MQSVIERIRKRVVPPLEALAGPAPEQVAKAALRVTQHWVHYGVGAVFVMGQLVALGARAAREAHEA